MTRISLCWHSTGLLQSHGGSSRPNVREKQHQALPLALHAEMLVTGDW